MKASLIVFIVLILVISVYYHWFFTSKPSRSPKSYCAWTKRKITTIANSSEPPPWFALLDEYNATVKSHRNMYLFPKMQKACNLRLGNRLFNYAATFGIAWQNERIPVWPQCKRTMKSIRYDFVKFFNLRVPKDRDNKVITVIYYTFSCLYILGLIEYFTRPN